MTAPHHHYQSSLHEIRRARNHAEMLRDQLQAEFDMLTAESPLQEKSPDRDSRRTRGLEAMRKAIKAVNQAIASIDQALRRMEWAGNDTDPPTDPVP